jgi:hypothetical protein
MSVCYLSDNTKAVLLRVDEAHDLINDALTELEEAVTGDTDDTNGNDDILDDVDSHFADLDINCVSGWSDADRLVVTASLGLMKTAKVCTKKLYKAISVHGRCDTVQVVTELDNYVDHINSLSPIVDELVSALYPPVKLPIVETMCERLGAVLKDLLSIARSSHFTTDDDIKWLDFLDKAVLHNMDKVNSLISSMQSNSDA